MQLKNHEKIVFTGDSVTDAGRKFPFGEGLGEGVGRGYVRQIENMLNVVYPDYHFHIVNTGTSGNTSRDLLARFDDEVLALNPTRVVIMIGINDVWRQFDEPSITSHHVLKSEYAENLQKMLEKCAQNNVIVSCITPFFMERNTDDAMRAKTDEYRAEMMRICKQNNVPCVDVQKAFDEYLKFRHPSYIMWDRVHPGEIGALIIAREYLRSVGFDRPII